jgi:hypothetical protein
MYKADVEQYLLKKLKKKKATEAEFAAAIGISQPAYHRWGKSTDGVIPEARAERLHRITNGALQYNPDLYLVAA